MNVYFEPLSTFYLTCSHLIGPNGVVLPFNDHCFVHITVQPWFTETRGCGQTNEEGVVHGEFAARAPLLG